MLDAELVPPHTQDGVGSNPLDLQARWGPNRAVVEATNWWSEQAIRPAVVTRKVCGGNRTWSGAVTQEILASILATCRKQDVSPYQILGDLYCAPDALVIRFQEDASRPIRPP